MTTIDTAMLHADLAGLLTGDTCRELTYFTRKGKGSTWIVDDADAEVAIVTAHDGPDVTGWYTGVNPVTGPPRKHPSRPNGKDVTHRTALFIDLDMHHDNRAPSDEEMALLVRARDRLFSQLVTQYGFPYELLRCGITGNGVTMQFRLPDLPNTPETNKLIAAIMDAMAAILAAEFPGVTLDTSGKDAGRLRRLAGSMNRKHDDPAEWRICQLDMNDDAEPVSIEALEALAAEAPRPVTGSRSTRRTDLVLTDEELDALVMAAAPGWKDGHRHNAGLAVAGLLAHMGVDFDQAFEIASRLWVNDHNPGDRLKALTNTYDRMAQGETVAWRQAMKRAMSKLEFDQLEGVQRAILRARGPEEAEPGDPEAGHGKARRLGGDLFTYQGAFVSIKQTLTGIPQVVPLANFTARIVRVVTKTNGAETTRFYDIEAVHQSGEIRTATVRVEDFRGMGWVSPELGVEFIVFAGDRVRDQVRQAIQQLSSEEGYDQRSVFGHTGWGTIDEDHVYLVGNGAIDRDGLRDDIITDLPGNLARVVLPEPVMDAALRPDALAFLRLLDVAPVRVTAALFAAPAAAVLGPFRPVDFVVHLHGRTGTHKTELAALVQRTMGAGYGRGHLLGWSSTANALNLHTFLAKDMPIVIDDFMPEGSASDQARMKATYQHIARAAGNQQGRSRMSADGSLRPEYWPRGLVISTGEDTAPGHSVGGRTLALEVEAGDVDTAILSELQAAAADGAFARLMAAVVCRIARNWEGLERRYQQEVDTHLVMLRGRQLAHARHPDILATLATAAQVWLGALVAFDAITSAERDTAWAKVVAGLLAAGTAQADVLHDVDPCRQFVRLISAALASKAAHLADPADNGEPKTSVVYGWRPRLVTVNGHDMPDNQPQGPQIGWVDARGVFLIPDAALSVAQQLGRQQGISIPWQEKTLGKRLQEGGYLVTVDPGRTTSRLTVNKTTRQRAWHLPLDRLVESDPGDVPDDNVRPFDRTRKESA